MSTFNFKHFTVQQSNSALKVGTDAMILGAIVQAELDKSTRILDIGSGTGVLSLMMAQKFPGSSITAIEIDEGAALDSRSNFEISPWSENLNLVQGDILDTDFEHTFDLIISNPPYYLNTLEGDNERLSRSKHSVNLPFESLLDKIKSLLSDNGSAWVIFAVESENYFKELISERGLNIHSEIKVEGKPGIQKRSIISFGHQNKNLQNSTLVIRDLQGKYTAEYITLTADFHSIDLSLKS